MLEAESRGLFKPPLPTCKLVLFAPVEKFCRAYVDGQEEAGPLTYQMGGRGCASCLLNKAPTHGLIQQV